MPVERRSECELLRREQEVSIVIGREFVRLPKRHRDSRVVHTSAFENKFVSNDREQ
jgi:hypothetical protein